MPYRSVNPHNNQLIYQFDQHSNEYMQASVSQAAKAFSTWSKKGFNARRKLFSTLLELLEERKQDVVALMALEMGKPVKEGQAEMEKCMRLVDYYIKHGEKMLVDTVLNPTSGQAWVSYQPLGCIIGVMPWNFPFWQVFRFAIPTLMAGNTVILKHAPNVPQCALAIEALFNDAGFALGVYQNLFIDNEQVAALIGEEAIQGISLTGSEAAGAAVAAQAGRHIKQSLLELGGSDPFIVLEDAEIASCAQVAAQSRMINSGQSCIAAKRFFVVERIYEDFLEAFTHEMKKYAPGNPMETDTHCGPLAAQRFVEQLTQQVQGSLDQGAVMHYQYTMAKTFGAYFPPTVLTQVRQGMPAFDEELFGPVAAVVQVKDQEEAVQLANRSRFGLGASVWTSDINFGRQLALKIDSGAVFINRLVASAPELPFGGIKHSGFGRELAADGMRAFVNRKTIVIP